MRHRFGRHFIEALALGAFSVLLLGCTDARTPYNSQLGAVAPVPPSNDLYEAATVTYQGKDTTALQMQMRGTSLFLTGRPFGFMRWEIGTTPESPQITFAMASQTNSFSQIGPWIVDYYASGALWVPGNVAFMSGIAGTSLVDIGNTATPVEIGRQPIDPTGVYAPAPSDENYIYKAMVSHPTLPYVYGFTQQESVFTVDASTNAMALKGADLYGANGENVCCVTSATVFQGKIYVAFQNRMVIMNMLSNGRLSNAGDYRDLHVVWVTSTPRYLYVQHKPIPNSGNTYPEGIYVFDRNLLSVGMVRYPAAPFRFSVAPSDMHLYANVDNKTVKIYRILWSDPSIPAAP